MSFPDAIKHVLSNYATFSGRARRSEYWFWALATLLVSFVAGFIESAVGTEAFSTVGLVTAIVALGLFLPSLAVTVRRLHDTSHSGGWVFIGLVPVVGPIILLIFLVTDSHWSQPLRSAAEGANRRTRLQLSLAAAYETSIRGASDRPVIRRPRPSVACTHGVVLGVDRTDPLGQPGVGGGPGPAWPALQPSK